LVEALNKTYEDVSFVAGDSPVVCNYLSDKGYNAIHSWVICDGPGDILCSFSRDGTNYGDAWTLKEGEMTALTGFDVATIKIEHLGTDSAYRVFMI